MSAIVILCPVLDSMYFLHGRYRPRLFNIVSGGSDLVRQNKLPHIDNYENLSRKKREGPKLCESSLQLSTFRPLHPSAFAGFPEFRRCFKPLVFRLILFACISKVFSLSLIDNIAFIEILQAHIKDKILLILIFIQAFAIPVISAENLSSKNLFFFKLYAESRVISNILE